MAKGDFNSYAAPKAEIKRFKIYLNIGSASSPVWELQGRGVGSWSQDAPAGDVSKESDVLGFVDMDRGASQPSFSGIELKLRNGNTLSKMIQTAVETSDYTALDSIDVLQKYEFVDGASDGKCRARLDKGCMIGIGSYGGEAGGYVTASIDIHLSNDVVTGEMDIEDADPVVFTPDGESDQDSDQDEE